MKFSLSIRDTGKFSVFSFAFFFEKNDVLFF